VFCNIANEIARWFPYLMPFDSFLNSTRELLAVVLQDNDSNVGMTFD